MKVDEKIAEFIGFFIGDGFAGKYNRIRMIQFTGHQTDEREYYENFLIPLVKDIFGKVTPHLTVRQRALRLTYYSKRIYEILVNEWKLPTGKKSDRVKIPEFLLKNSKLIKSVVKGIFDADGSVFWDKRKNYKKPYPRLTIQITSKELSNQLYCLLKDLNFNPCRRESKGKKTYKNSSKSYFVELYGHSNFRKWVKEIYFSNSKHIKRLMPH